ncbi:hypothetical protein, partial [Streptomyces diastatochromogenes]|uniref:hypothetical protein n=1 Tax=Streptomyces diastatochromogenes TaxID=42236 RepID=UPI0036C7FEB8
RPPAGAVVFAGAVRTRPAADPGVAGHHAKAAGSGTADRAALDAELAEVTEAVRAEKLSEVAAEFDGIHTIQRAVEVGSVDRIISAAQLRPAVIEAIEKWKSDRSRPTTGGANGEFVPPARSVPVYSR